MRHAPGFLAGVIEGFYGQPWSQAERFELFDWMSAWGLNTYLYAPKDDLKHRALWREPYFPAEEESLRAIIERCQQSELRFIYALSPGLDIRYSQESELECLKKRFEQMLALGCQDFALLFDDIPDRMEPQDCERWDSFAAAQCHVTNAIFGWLRERNVTGRLLFCPTPYCDRMAERKLGGEGYLKTVGRNLLPEIDVFWTGPEIISREIPLTHIETITAVLRRKPLIWDNLHANDYDGRRFYCGPYSGRAPGLRGAVSGLLINPNNEFPLNYVPLRTLAEFIYCDGSWHARKAYLNAMRQWLPYFETVGHPLTIHDLVLLGDCFYLPHEEGAEAEEFYDSTRRLLAAEPGKWGGQVIAFRKRASQLRDCCARLTELRHRPLFYALSRRLWELREELDLLLSYVRQKVDGGTPDTPCRSDFHLPGTYRGGMVPRLQHLLTQHSDGTFAPSRETAAQGNVAANLPAPDTSA